jgi:[lysine-biosynthesis-protein LysW]--L-2-aminoadipate ligase
VNNGFHLGLFYTIVRQEERWLLEAAARRGVPVERLSDESTTFDLSSPNWDLDVVLNRSVSHSRAVYAGQFFAHYGIPTVNLPEVVELSGDKVRASLRLAARGIPTPKTVVALTPEAALEALDRLGYPAVLKPPIGSWGRLMAKVESRREAEQIIEHKSALASPNHSVFYLQEFVPKPDRDIRAFVIGDHVAAAMYRRSSAWRTNTARGGEVEPLVPTAELSELALRASEAVGGGVLAVDLMESPSGLVVHEVNPTPEFKGLVSATGVDVAEQIVDYALQQGRR